MGFRTSGKKVKQQILLNDGKIALCKCDNFVPIVVFGRSSEAHLTSSGEDSADSMSWQWWKRHDAPKRKETPSKAVPMKGIPVKAVPMRIPVKPIPCRHANSARALAEVPVSIPIEERKWRDIFLCGIFFQRIVWHFMESDQHIKTCTRTLWIRWSNTLINFDVSLRRIRTDRQLGLLMIGKHVWKRVTNKIREECCLDDSSKIQSIEINSWSFRRATNESKTAMCLFFTDGRITFITWDHRMITSLFLKQISLQEESDFEKDDSDTYLQQSILCWQQCSHIDTKQKNTHNILSHWHGDQCAMQCKGLICDSREIQDWNFG